MVNTNVEPIPTVQPDAAPEVLNRPAVNANMFGAGKAQATEQLGQGLLKTGSFYGEVAADQAYNNYEAETQKLLHGDPSKMVPGPDGQMVPDTGYMGLSGAAAMAARPALAQKMDDLAKQARDSVWSPQEALRFDNNSRRYRSLIDGQIGTHADTQQKVWASSVNETGYKLKFNQAILNANNNEEFQNAESDMVSFAVKEAQNKGLDIGAAAARARAEAWTGRLHAIGSTDPSKAKALLERPDVKGIVGPRYGELYEHLDNRELTMGSSVAADHLWESAATPTAGAPSGGGPVTPTMLRRALVTQESGGRQFDDKGNTLTSVDNAKGAGQMLQGTFDKYALPGEKITNRDDNLAASARAIDDYYRKYSGDSQRVAVAYFSGEGNVAPAGSPTPWKQDLKDGNGKSVSSYVGDISKRLGVPQAASGEPASLSDNDDAQQGLNAPPDLKDSSDRLPDTSSLAPPSPDEKVAQQKLAVHEQLNRALEGAKGLGRLQDQAEVHLQRKAMVELATIDAREKVRKEQVATAGSDYINQAKKGNAAQALSQMWDDNRFSGQDKLGLEQAMLKAAGRENEVGMGESYMEAQRRLLLPYGDPNKITDPSQIVSMQANGALTTRGGEEIRRMYQELHFTENGSLVRQRASMERYAQSRLVFHGQVEDDNYTGIKDPQGMQLFNGVFADKVNQAYQKWTQDDKKAPLEFWTPEKMDELVNGIRSEKDRNQARIEATQTYRATHMNETQRAAQPVPAPPEDIRPDEWTNVAKRPPTILDPKTGNRAPMTADYWMAKVKLLIDHRDDPAYLRKFNQEMSKGPEGTTVNPRWTAEEVLDSLRPYSPEDKVRDQQELDERTQMLRNLQ